MCHLGLLSVHPGSHLPTGVDGFPMQDYPLPTDIQLISHLPDKNRLIRQEWIASLGSGYVYVGGRTRPKGEMNGKSGNLNNVCSQIYPPGLPIPGNEIICIFDADQVIFAAQ